MSDPINGRPGNRAEGPRFSPITGVLDGAFAAERERWLLWTPVCLGAGIAIYFALPFEPSLWSGVLLTLASLALAFISRDRLPVFVTVMAFSATALGLTTATWRSQSVEAPVLAKRVGPATIEGRVLSYTPLAAGGHRLLLADPRVSGLAAAETPDQVRLTVRTRGEQARPGRWVQLRGVLMPPPGPAAPGGFDFARQAWFQRLGAVGYAVSPLRAAPGGGNPSLSARMESWLAGFRQSLGERIRGQMPGRAGAVTAALITGDRGAVPDQALDDLRDVGLAHLLAISGLHMGLLAGSLFFAVRALLALIEPLALRYPIKKWAAAVALMGAFFYLLTSGMTVSARRAFIMAGVGLLAVMLDRPVLSMRLVAFAAAAILLLTPESLTHAGFQMSFAAVVALIATYEALRGRWPLGRKSLPRLVALYLLGIMLTTLVAEAATAPFGIFHFNRFISYGLVANLFAVPIMGFWIMPWILVALVLMPLGLEGPALTAVGWGIEAVLGIAAEVARWPGAVTLVPAAPDASLGLVVFGGLWLCLWSKRWRLLGLLPMAVAVTLAVAARPPDILVDRDAGMVGVRGATGMAISHGRAKSYAGEMWLRRSGLANAEPWPRSGMLCDSHGCREISPEGLVISLAWKAEAMAEDCQTADVMISFVPVRGACRRASVVIDRFDLWRNGAHALWLEKGDTRVVSSRSVRGDRPWVPYRSTRKAQ